MKPRRIRRGGQPLVAFIVLLGGWAVLRAALWESPWPLNKPFVGPVPILAVAERLHPPTLLLDAEARAAQSPERQAKVPFGSRRHRSFGSPSAGRILLDFEDGGLVTPGPQPAGHGQARTVDLMRPGETASKAAKRGHAAGPRTEQSHGTDNSPRWSGDAWLLWRESGSRTTGPGPQPASYGASQLGAVLRYRLAPRSPARPALYLRASHALIERGESEAALGISARPIRGLPITAHAELRLTKRSDDTDLSPAAFVTAGGELSGLPRAWSVRAYGAAGYVGGRHSTAFVDGQIVAEREMVRFDLGALRAGVGTWGGAQRGAARLDVGPSASVVAKLDKIPLRLSVDYRLRVSGDAEPASGAALTLSTGF